MPTWLSPAGAAWAAAVGAAVLLGTGGRGLALLFLFFITSSALSPGGGRRRAVQVLANGGVAALCALLARLVPDLAVAFAGALAAAAADTWSTEIGARSQAPVRLITSFRAVAPGTSGGVTLLGTLGGAAGAATIALGAWLLGVVTWRDGAVVVAAGFAGMVLDSLLGATLQVRWRCRGCGALTESREHRCPEPIPESGERKPKTQSPLSALRSPASNLEPARGIRWMTNDTVNLACTLVGATLAALPRLLAAG